MDRYARNTEKIPFTPLSLRDSLRREIASLLEDPSWLDGSLNEVFELLERTIGNNEQLPIFKKAIEDLREKLRSLSVPNNKIEEIVTRLSALAREQRAAQRGDKLKNYREARKTWSDR